MTKSNPLKSPESMTFCSCNLCGKVKQIQKKNDVLHGENPDPIYMIATLYGIVNRAECRNC